jgi:hypothetical protein
MDLVIVESPAKAKTINKYLGRGYEVMASFGHVRDLPPKSGSVDPDANFRMLWEVDKRWSEGLTWHGRVPSFVMAGHSRSKNGYARSMTAECLAVRGIGYPKM